MILKTIENIEFEIDDEDYKSVLRFGNNFRLLKNYVIVYKSFSRLKFNLSRIILKSPFTNKDNIDHKDGNTLNYKKSNLRWATFSQNQANSKKHKNGTSSLYKGVCFNKQKKKFTAAITFNRVRKHLGYFLNELDAAIAYDNEAIKIWGEFAKPNFSQRVTTKSLY